MICLQTVQAKPEIVTVAVMKFNYSNSTASDPTNQRGKSAMSHKSPNKNALDELCFRKCLEIHERTLSLQRQATILASRMTDPLQTTQH